MNIGNPILDLKKLGIYKETAGVDILGKLMHDAANNIVNIGNSEKRNAEAIKHQTNFNERTIGHSIKKASDRNTAWGEKNLKNLNKHEKKIKKDSNLTLAQKQEALQQIEAGRQKIKTSVFNNLGKLDQTTAELIPNKNPINLADREDAYLIAQGKTKEKDQNVNRKIKSNLAMGVNDLGKIGRGIGKFFATNAELAAKKPRMLDKEVSAKSAAIWNNKELSHQEKLKAIKEVHANSEAGKLAKEIKEKHTQEFQRQSTEAQNNLDAYLEREASNDPYAAEMLERYKAQGLTASDIYNSGDGMNWGKVARSLPEELLYLIPDLVAASLTGGAAPIARRAAIQTAKVIGKAGVKETGKKGIQTLTKEGAQEISKLTGKNYKAGQELNKNLIQKQAANKAKFQHEMIQSTAPGLAMSPLTNLGKTQAELGHGNITEEEALGHWAQGMVGESLPMIAGAGIMTKGMMSLGDITRAYGTMSKRKGRLAAVKQAETKNLAGKTLAEQLDQNPAEINGTLDNSTNDSLDNLLNDHINTPNQPKIITPEQKALYDAGNDDIIDELIQQQRTTARQQEKILTKQNTQNQPPPVTSSQQAGNLADDFIPSDATPPKTDTTQLNTVLQNLGQPVKPAKQVKQATVKQATVKQANTPKATNPDIETKTIKEVDAPNTKKETNITQETKTPVETTSEVDIDNRRATRQKQGFKKTEPEIETKTPEIKVEPETEAPKVKTKSNKKTKVETPVEAPVKTPKTETPKAETPKKGLAALGTKETPIETAPTHKQTKAPVSKATETTLPIEKKQNPYPDTAEIEKRMQPKQTTKDVGDDTGLDDFLTPEQKAKKAGVDSKIQNEKISGTRKEVNVGEGIEDTLKAKQAHRALEEATERKQNIIQTEKLAKKAQTLINKGKDLGELSDELKDAYALNKMHQNMNSLEKVNKEITDLKNTTTPTKQKTNQIPDAGKKVETSTKTETTPTKKGLAALSAKETPEIKAEAPKTEAPKAETPTVAKKSSIETILDKKIENTKNHTKTELEKLSKGVNIPIQKLTKLLDAKRNGTFDTNALEKLGLTELTAEKLDSLLLKETRELKNLNSQKQAFLKKQAEGNNLEKIVKQEPSNSKKKNEIDTETQNKTPNQLETIETKAKEATIELENLKKTPRSLTDIAAKDIDFNSDLFKKASAEEQFDATIKKGRNTYEEIINTPDDLIKTRQHAITQKDFAKNQIVKEKLEAGIENGDYSYTVKRNDDLIETATNNLTEELKHILKQTQDGKPIHTIQTALDQIAKNLSQDIQETLAKKLTISDEMVAKSQILIQKISKTIALSDDKILAIADNTSLERLLDIQDSLIKAGTEAGRTVQALSLARSKNLADPTVALYKAQRAIQKAAAKSPNADLGEAMTKLINKTKGDVKIVREFIDDLQKVCGWKKT